MLKPYKNTSKFGEFKELPSSTGVHLYMLNEQTTPPNSMVLLDKAGLRPLTQRESYLLMSKLMVDKKLMDSLQGSGFYLKEVGLQGYGYYHIDEDGNLVEGRGKSAEETIAVAPGEYHSALTIFPDWDVQDFGVRFVLTANMDTPTYMAPAILGIPKNNLGILGLLRQDMLGSQN